jgi:hydroxymethylbilane synthase
MAAAALEVLGWTDRIDDYFDVDTMVPAVGQGCVAVECRDGDESVLQLLTGIDHESSRLSVERERAFLAELGSGCSLPVGAYDNGESMIVHLSSDDGSVHHRETIPTGDARSHGDLLDAARAGARAARSAVGG